MLRQSLRKAGIYGYRINYRDLTGTPDIVFLNRKIAIFCGSDFWHGRKGVPDQIKDTGKKSFVKMQTVT